MTPPPGSPLQPALEPTAGGRGFKSRLVRASHDTDLSLLSYGLIIRAGVRTACQECSLVLALRLIRHLRQIQKQPVTQVISGGEFLVTLARLAGCRSLRGPHLLASSFPEIFEIVHERPVS